MLIKENFGEIEGRKMVRHYSNENKYIKKVGTEEIYEDAADFEDLEYEYTETDDEIKNEEETVQNQAI